METLIINKAKALFFSYGIKSVSMDDLARVSGLSKKTIYQFFADKQQLVNRVVDDLLVRHRQALSAGRESRNPVEEIVHQSGSPFQAFVDISGSFFHELEKFFPSIWKKLVDHRDEVLRPAIARNLQRGMEEAYFREDLNVNLTASIRLQQLSTALNPRNLTGSRYSSRQLMQDLTSFYLHGIATAKGKKMIYKYLNRNNEN